MPEKKHIGPESAKRKKIFTRMSIIVALGLFVLLLASISVASAALAIMANYWNVGENEGVFYSIVTLAISVVVGMALSFAYSALMIKVTKPYLEAMQRISEFDFSVRIKDSRLFADLEIAENFNEMACRLQSVELLREDFVSNFSHEFKTPIVSISGFATLLKNPDLSAEEREEYLNVIIDESARLVRLSESVLMLSRLDSQTIENEEFLLDEQLRQSMLLFDHAASEKGVALSAELEKITVVNEKKLMSQIWINLLSNAVKFTPRGGKVEVSAQDVDGVVTVCIRDSGCGMDETTQKNMFNKFYQGDTSHATEGNGLGLSVVKKICDLLYIQISVESAVGVGTLFTLVFPDRSIVKNHTTVLKE